MLQHFENQSFSYSIFTVTSNINRQAPPLRWIYADSRTPPFKVDEKEVLICFSVFHSKRSSASVNIACHSQRQQRRAVGWHNRCSWLWLWRPIAKRKPLSESRTRWLDGDIEQGECLVQNNKVSKLNDVLLLPNDASLQLFWTVEDSGKSSIWSKFLRISTGTNYASSSPLWIREPL